MCISKSVLLNITAATDRSAGLLCDVTVVIPFQPGLPLPNLLCLRTLPCPYPAPTLPCASLLCLPYPTLLCPTPTLHPDLFPPYSVHLSVAALFFSKQDCVHPIVQEKKQLLSFVVVGGGPTGVEVAAELQDMVESDLVKVYPDLISAVRIAVIELQDHVLSTYDRRISDYTRQIFTRYVLSPIPLGCFWVQGLHTLQHGLVFL